MLSEAPSTFTMAINNVPLGLGKTTYMIFMDDTLIFSKTNEEHADRISRISRRMTKANFNLNLAKCHFAQLRTWDF